MSDQPFSVPERLKFLRDEASRSTTELLATKAGAQRLTVFSVAVLGAVVPLFAAEMPNAETKIALLTVVVLLSSIFYGRAHILYHQAVLKGAYHRYLEIITNRLLDGEVFSDPEAVRVTGIRVENRINMLVIPIIYVVMGFCILYFGFDFSEGFAILLKSVEFLVSVFCIFIVLLIIFPILFRIFSSGTRFEKAVSNHLLLHDGESGP
jgi:hypothetical protein